MPYDEEIANRIRKCMSVHAGQIIERKMMGGLIFMLDGHMCCGASENGLMVRLGEESAAVALQQPVVKPLDIGGGRSPKAFVRVAADAIETEQALQSWVNKGVAFVRTLPARIQKS